MRGKRRLLFLFLPAAVLAGFVYACGEDDPIPGPKASFPDAGLTVLDGGSIASDSATILEPTLLKPTVVQAFDASSGELAESVTLLDGGPEAGSSVIVSLAPRAQVVKLRDGGVDTVGAVASPANVFALGLVSDDIGNVYVALGAAGTGPSPSPGLYRIPAGGGTPAAFSLAATPAMQFPNGVDRIGSDFYVSDSANGVIYRVEATGTTSVWLDHEDLKSSKDACKSQAPFPIGVNGITHDATSLYAVNFDKGLLLKIPRDKPDAGAGTPARIYDKNCDLHGADGIAFDGTSILIANNPKNVIQRVTLTGTLTKVAEGAPLDGPAGLWLDGKRLYITSSAFGSASMDGGKPAPSLLFVTLP